MNKHHNFVKNTSKGFVLMSGAIIIFVILSIFSLFLLRVVVNGNSISAYNLLDGKTRNLAVSGLEYGVQLFKDNEFGGCVKMLLKEMALSKVVIYLNALSYYSSVFWSNWSNEVCTRNAFK